MPKRSGRRAVPAMVAIIVASSLAVGGPLAKQPSNTAQAATPRHASLPVHSNGKVVVRDLPRAKATRGRKVMPRRSAQVARERSGGSQPAAFRPTSGLRVAGAVTPSPALQAAFSGLSQADDTALFGGAIEPPDPWVAVGPNAVVQSVNSLVRITDRAGQSPQTFIVDSFFGVEPNQEVVSDPRIIYDAAHDRWIGVILSFACTTSGFLYLAVSDTSDPLGTWKRWVFDDGAFVPDYPGLGSSTDKIVISANQYAINAPAPNCVETSPTTSSLVVFDWAAVLDGVPLLDNVKIDEPGYFAWRPAPNLSPDPTIYLVAEDLSYGDVTYATITGDLANANDPNPDLTPVEISPLVDLSYSTGIPSFIPPPAPRQPGSPSTIDLAVD